jgi:exosortase
VFKVRIRFIYFWAAVIVLCAIFTSQLANLISFSFSEGYSSHIVLAPIISIYLFWNSRRRIFKRLESAFLPALLIGAVASTGVFLASYYGAVLNHNDYLSVTAFSFCLLVVAIFLASFGRSAVREATFPLAMLLFFVPLPSEISQRLILALQSGSAVLVHWLFLLLRVPVLRDGFVFTVPGVSIEIASECSGINSSIALLITALLVAHATLRKNSSRLMFVLFTVPLSIVKNGIRIVTLTLLATHIDMSFLTGKLHHRGGVLFFLLTLAFMVPIWKWLKHSEEDILGPSSFVSREPASSLPPAT